jgi:DNA (cytosine-5)-methyltransferase 1
MNLGVIDLFAGCGGASQGIKQTDGFEVVGAVDNHSVAVDTYDNNHSVTPWEKDLTEVEFDDILDHFELSEDDVDVIIGCPPCQNFSTLRDTEEWDEDEPKDELLKTFLGLIQQSEVSLVFFENVPGIITSDGGQYLEYFKSEMRDFGYGIEVDVVNAADYGVPQARRRTIGIGVLGADDEDISIPKRTHAPPHEAEKDGLKHYRTVRDGIDKEWLDKLERGQSDESDPAHRSRRHHDSTMEIIEAIPKDGGSRSDLPEELELECHSKVGSAAGNVYGRMSWSDPAPTLTTRCTTPSCGRFLHPEQDRSISFREAALLMTFPREFKLPEKNGDAEQVIGNAVPPNLVESILSGFLQENMDLLSDSLLK